MQNTISQRKNKYNKRFSFYALLTALFILFTLSATAQAPEAFRYQAVVRNDAGQALANKNVDLKIRLLQGEQMEEVFVEKHETTTNDFGLVVLEIGKKQGSETSNVDWGKGATFIEISLKDNQGHYTVLGTTQLLSVPYAFYANEIENKDDNDADSLNEIQHLKLDSTLLSLTNSSDTIDLAALQDGVNDADTSVTNELIDSITVQNNKIIIHEGSNTTSIDINEMVKDKDHLPDNEVIDTAYLKENKLRIREREGKSHNYYFTPLDSLDQSDMDTDDNDADTTNELQEMSIIKDRINLSYPLDSIVGDSVDLSYLKQDNQQLHVEYACNDVVDIRIDRGNTIVLCIHDNDNSPENEIQNLQQVLEENNNAGGKKITNLETSYSNKDAINKDYADGQAYMLDIAFENSAITSLVTSSSNKELIVYNKQGLIKDGRDGHIYRIKKFDTTWWMCDDLDYEGADGNGEYYEYSPTEYHYGKYYDKNEALDNFCPDGWEIPDTTDFNDLHAVIEDGSELLASGTSGCDFVKATYYYHYGGGSYKWASSPTVAYWTSFKNSSGINIGYRLNLTDGTYMFLEDEDHAVKARIRCIKK